MQVVAERVLRLGDGARHAERSPASSIYVSQPLKPVLMSRVQLALNVDDLDGAIAFYSKLFNAEPTKVKPGYANFAIADPPLKLVLLENPGQGGTLNHLGVEVDSSEVVHDEIARLDDAGMFTEEQIAIRCCFAAQDKVWVTGPGGERWEVYTVLAASETFGTSPAHLDTPTAGQAVCCTTSQGAAASAPSCC
jgi:catechol 2,3-dioxygenase-like lactoylglutathione lyase family enzyme